MDEYVAHCPACGEPIDYCQGHGPIGDPYGAFILKRHDEGNHYNCNPFGCQTDFIYDEEVLEEAPQTP